MSLLSIRNVSLGFGGPLLFDRINLQIEPGERMCLVGRNGEGKTTLLNLINGSILPDKGEIYRQPGLRHATLVQEIPSDLTGRVFDMVANGLKRNNTGSVQDLPHGTGDKVPREEMWQLPAWVKKVRTQLKLDPDADFNTLSAGLKRRGLLARTLAGSPDILLLGDPTNHLDIGSIGLVE